MGYSPKQMQAFLFLADKRHQVEHANQLSLHTLAARGDPKLVKKKLQQVQRDQ